MRPIPSIAFFRRILPLKANFLTLRKTRSSSLRRSSKPTHPKSTVSETMRRESSSSPPCFGYGTYSQMTSSRSDSHFAALRNKDINQYNEQAKEMAQLICEHQKMKIRVEGYEKAMADADADAR